MEQHTPKKRKIDTYCIEYQEYTPKDDINRLYKINQRLLEEVISMKEENQKIIKELQLILKWTKTQKYIQNESNQSNQSNQKESMDSLLNLDQLTFTGECSYIN